MSPEYSLGLRDAVREAERERARERKKAEYSSNDETSSCSSAVITTSDKVYLIVGAIVGVIFGFSVGGVGGVLVGLIIGPILGMILGWLLAFLFGELLPELWQCFVKFVLIPLAFIIVIGSIGMAIKALWGVGLSSNPTKETKTVPHVTGRAIKASPPSSTLRKERKIAPSVTGGVINTPPPEIVVTDACPGEKCELGKWVAREIYPVYDSDEGGTIIRKLRQGEEVYATSAKVRAVPKKLVVTGVYKTGEDQGLDVGSIFYVLYSDGEGYFAVWNNGKVMNVYLDSFHYEEPFVYEELQWTWWVHVRLEDGTTGWLKNPKRKLY